MVRDIEGDKERVDGEGREEKGNKVRVRIT